MPRNLIKSLLNVAEKASNVARKIREDETLLQLLTQEKYEDEANPRFVHDFKTLADVLIQEIIKDDIGIMFPELKSNIKGEESSMFTNSLGETLCVQIGKNEKETAASLEIILNGNKRAASILATVVHKKENVSDDQNIPEFPENFDYSKLGIWIDPIDATSQYIAGDSIFSNFPGITSTGLDCVTVLIGVYDQVTGIPICGVIVQPFSEKLNENDYKSKAFWGICLGDIKVNNLNEKDIERPTRIGIFSTSEHSDIINVFKEEKYEIAFSAGAGHKALKIITSEADVYLLSKGTTFKWDTCSPHAILLSQGGCMYDFQESLNTKELIPLVYNTDENKQNRGGVVAVKDINLIKDLLERLS